MPFSSTKLSPYFVIFISPSSFVNHNTSAVLFVSILIVSDRSLSIPYIRLKAIRHLEKGRIVIFAAGTGNPYFTTDTAASLRAAEIDADIVLKSTRVEGVYSSDPEKNDNADLYSQISYKDVVEKKLGVMDLTAITLCEENKMPIRVFDGTQNTNIYNVLTGNELGTLIN